MTDSTTNHDKPDVREWNGKLYEHDFMLEVIDKIPRALEAVKDAEEELDSALSSAESAFDDYEEAQLEAEQMIDEWRDLQPFWDEIESRSLDLPRKSIPDANEIVKRRGFWQ